MKKHRQILLCVLALALLGVAVSVKWTEPRYHLRPISYWLARYGEGPAKYQPSPEADHALRQMGSNAVPYLLELLRSTNCYSHFTLVGKDAPGAITLTTPPASGLGVRWRAWSTSLRSRFQHVTIPASWNHWKVYLAFQALGDAGSSAIPDLVKFAHLPSTNSSPSNGGETPPIRFWKDNKEITTFAAQSSTYRSPRSPVFPADALTMYSGVIPQPFLTDAEIAAWSLAAVGADSVPPLITMLTNANPQIRCRAAMALGMVGRPAEPAVAALVIALHDPDRNTRRAAADALGWIGQPTDIVIPALIEAFADRDVESAAIDSLGVMGKRATNAIPALLTHFHTGYKAWDQTRGQYRIGNIVSALNQISPETTRKEVLPMLIARFHGATSPWIRNMTLSTLGNLTNQADLVVPILLEALDTTTNYPQLSAVNQLGKFGPAATSAVPRLVAFSTGPDTNLCRLATNSLDKIKPGWRTNR